MNPRFGVTSVLSILLTLLLPGPAGAQSQQSSDDISDTRQVVAGERYRADGLHRLVFGAQYRDLWTIPIEVELLDLDREAGGLVPVREVGRNQTAGLALRGADGRSYTFRGIDKDPTAILAPELLGTPIAELAQDQVSASLPGAPVVAAAIAEAAGVRQFVPRIVVLPDHPALGVHRGKFAGRLGTFEEFPTEGAWGSRRIVSGRRFIDLITASHAERPDSEAFLRARLVDLLLGDWDRHVDQWRWAQIPGVEGWQPLPEDRDQAFSHYGGLAMALIRNREPKFDRFGERYAGLEGSTWNARSLDRRFLSGLDRESYVRIARDVKSRLDDATIDGAVGRLPAEYRALRGDDLVASLRARRDDIVEQAEAFYRYLATQVDIRATNTSESVWIERREDGSLAIVIASAEDCARKARSAGAAVYRRRFLPNETDEIRLYTGGGEDCVRIMGPDVAHIDVTIVGGGGQLTVREQSTGAVLAFDGSTDGQPGTGQAVSAGVRVAPSAPIERTGTPATEQGTAKDARRDWGSTTYTQPWWEIGPDLGFFAGMGWTRETFGFRKRPFATQQRVRIGFSTGARRPRVDYRGVFRRENRRGYLRVDALASGIETLNFYGIGNETSDVENARDRRVQRTELRAATTFVQPVGKELEFSTGPVIRYSVTDEDEDDLRLVNLEAPYGAESIAQVGWSAALSYNARRRPSPLTLRGSDDPTRFEAAELGSGITVDGRAVYYPELLDLRDDYLLLEGVTTATLWAGDGGPGLSLRVGGRRNWGDVPYYDLAFVGAEQVRGLPAERFAGDSSVFANLALLIPTGRISLVVPGTWGVIARGGVGRVFVDEADSGRWHRSAGGGVWWTSWNYSQALRVYVADTDEGLAGYVQAGYDF